jgi:hypothetical protein
MEDFFGVVCNLKEPPKPKGKFYCTTIRSVILCETECGKELKPDIMRMIWIWYKTRLGIIKQKVEVSPVIEHIIVTT